MAAWRAPGLGALRVGALLLAGCEVEEWRNADLQLDVDAAALDSTTLIRVCVAGTGSRDHALGGGRVAYPGLPAEGALTVTVDALQAQDTGLDAVLLGRAGPVVFDGDDHLEATWAACEADCTPCREADATVDEQDNRLLAVRFLGLD